MRACFWACKEEDWYTTSCDAEISEENTEFSFCPHCGKKLIAYNGNDPYKETGKSVLELMNEGRHDRD